MISSVSLFTSVRSLDCSSFRCYGDTFVFSSSFWKQRVSDRPESEPAEAVVGTHPGFLHAAFLSKQNRIIDGTKA